MPLVQELLVDKIDWWKNVFGRKIVWSNGCLL